MPARDAPVVTDVGLFHRLGIAVRGEGTGTARWFADSLGAVVESSRPEPGDTHTTTMLQLGPTTVAVFAAGEGDTTGTIARYLERFGAGLHSLAWRVTDLDGAEQALRSRGLTVVGVNREARHFFLHPKETFGILIEFTDQGRGLPRSEAHAAGPVREVAWITAVVRDAAAGESFLTETLGAQRVVGAPAGPESSEHTIDVVISDIILRLVQPRSAASRYAGFGSEVGDRLHSVALRVDSLDHVPVPLVERRDRQAWSDPADTLGLRLEWVE